MIGREQPYIDANGSGSYQPTKWLDDVPGIQTGTPMDEHNFNNMESGINSANLTAEFFSQTLKSYMTEKPLVLYHEKASEYLEDSVIGDEVLGAIMRMKQVLVRVPNKDGGNHTAIYSPVIMYQLPNYQSDFMYLFYMNDGTDDNGLPSFGQLKIKLSKTFDKTPLI